MLAGPRLHDDFVRRPGRGGEEPRVGDPADAATELGPVVSADQRERVAGFVDRAVAAGADGRDRRRGRVDGAGFFYEPTRDRRRRPGRTRSSSGRCSARSSPCSASPTKPRPSRGPTASTTAWPPRCGPRDVGRALRVANALQFGTVWVNDHGPLVSEMPHGGFKQSGVGKDMSVYAIEAYTELKHVMVKTG